MAEFPYMGLRGRMGDWRHWAVCRGADPNLFYPDLADLDAMEVCASVCRSCPVVEACLNYALRYENLGYWGGADEQSRRRMRAATGIELEVPHVSYHAAG